MKLDIHWIEHTYDKYKELNYYSFRFILILNSSHLMNLDHTKYMEKKVFTILRRGKYIAQSVLHSNDIHI